MIEAQSFAETSALTRATRRNIPEDAILHLTFHFQNAKLLSFTELLNGTLVCTCTTYAASMAQSV
jgi:hypothetical protein